MSATLRDTSSTFTKAIDGDITYAATDGSGDVGASLAAYRAVKSALAEVVQLEERGNVFGEQKPVIRVAPRSASLTTGSPLVLHCHASGTPTPQVTWTHNGAVVASSRFWAHGRSGNSTCSVGTPRVEWGCHVLSWDASC